MYGAIAQFLLSGAIIVAVGTFLTRFADTLAEETGLGRLMIGSLLLAGATSLPEFMVDLNAVKMGHPDLAAGDLLGSSVFNLLILAVLDFAYPSAVRRTAFTQASLHHSLSAMVSLLVTAVVGIGIVSRLGGEILGIDMFLWAALGLYLLSLRMIYHERTLQPGQEGEARVRPVRELLRREPVLRSVLGFVACALVIVVASPYLVRAADRIAAESGLGHSMVGTIFVALATSLPELVATLAALRMGAADLALGNIFGSNAFNMILFLPLDALQKGSLLTVVRVTHAVTAFGIVAITAVAVMGHLYRRKERSRIWEPSSEIIGAMVLGLLTLLALL